jgi:hypothetical protein
LFEAQVVIVGSTVSLTVTVKLQLAAPPFPEQVTVVMPTGNVEPDAGVQTTSPHESPSVEGCEYVTAAVHWPASTGRVISGPQVSKQSTSLSTTETVKLQFEELFDASVAVQVTVVVPVGKMEPDAGVQLVVTAEQLSLVSGSGKSTLVPLLPGATSALTLAGHMIEGASASFPVTVTLKLQGSPVSPAHVTVVVPDGNVDPAGGLHCMGAQAPPVPVAGE